MIPRRWGPRDPEVVLTLHVSLTRFLVDVKMGLSNPATSSRTWEDRSIGAPTYDANLGTTKFWDHFSIGWIQYWYRFVLLYSFFSHTKKGPRLSTSLQKVVFNGWKAVQPCHDDSATQNPGLCQSKKTRDHGPRIQLLKVYFYRHLSWYANFIYHLDL